MKKIFFLSCVFLLNISLNAQETVGRFYEKNYEGQITAFEQEYINHAKKSYENAMKKKSKLNENLEFMTDTKCNSKYGIISYYHLVNNLCSLKNSSHLHIGLYTGGSFVGALYKNQDLLKSKIGIDWFLDDWGYHDIFNKVCNKYLIPNQYQVISTDCFNVDKSIFTNPIDIYVYDADHSTEAHAKAFTYYNDILANVFIAVVDDWNWEQVRTGTFNGFDQLEYSILYQNEIPAADDKGNGQYVAVIKKPSF